MSFDGFERIRGSGAVGHARSFWKRAKIAIPRADNYPQISGISPQEEQEHWEAFDWNPNDEPDVIDKPSYDAMRGAFGANLWEFFERDILARFEKEANRAVCAMLFGQSPETQYSFLFRGSERSIVDAKNTGDNADHFLKRKEELHYWLRNIDLTKMSGEKFPLICNMQFIYDDKYWRFHDFQLPQSSDPTELFTDHEYVPPPPPRHVPFKVPQFGLEIFYLGQEEGRKKYNFMATLGAAGHIVIHDRGEYVVSPSGEDALSTYSALEGVDFSIELLENSGKTTVNVEAFSKTQNKSDGMRFVLDPNLMPATALPTLIPPMADGGMEGE